MIIDEGNRIMRGKQIVNNKGQIVDQENFNKTLFSLMDERFKGGMEIQATSFKGLWSTILGVGQTTISTLAGISATGEVIAGGFFDKIKQKMQGVVDKINEWQENGQLQEWAGKVSNAMSNMWNVAEKVFNGLITAGKFVYDNWNLILPVLTGVLGAFMAYKTAVTVINSVKMAQMALNMVLNMNPMGMVVLAIGALVTAGTLLYKNWGTITKKASELWNGIKTVFGNIKNTVVNLWSEAVVWGENIIKGIGTGFVNMTGWIKDQVLGFCQKIGSTVKDFFGIASPSKLMTEYGKYVAEGFANGIKNGTNSTAEKATAMATAIKSALDNVLNSTTLTVSIAQTEFEKLKLKMGENADQSFLYQAQVNLLTTQIKSQTDAIVLIQKAYTDMVAVKGQNSIEAQELYLKLVQEQKAYLELKNQMDALKNTQDLVALGFKNITEKIDKSLVSLAKWVDKVANLGKDSASVAKGLSSKNKKKVNEAANVMALTQQWKKTGTIIVNKGVPQFDAGGTVPGTIGSPQLIMAHGGETILPTHKRGFGGSVDITVTGNYIANDYDIEEIGEQLVRVLRRKGVLVGA